MIRSKFHTQQIYPPAGQIKMANIYNEEEVKDKKLSDYIKNVLKEEGLEPKKKLTFDEWYHLHCDDSLCYETARLAWKAAQENV